MKIQTLFFLVLVLFFSCSEDDSRRPHLESVHTESFDDPDEWDITIEKHPDDARSRAEFTSGQLHLIAGTHDSYTEYAAQTAAKKTINEFDIREFHVISEIRIMVEFNAFALRTFYNPNYHQMRLKIGPYTIYERTQQPHSNVPLGNIFTYIISVPGNDLYNATAIRDVLYASGGTFSRPITSYNAEFDISATEFNAHAIVEFSAATGNAGGSGYNYPANSNTLIIKSLVITVTGEPAI